eukprot:CAMPEP_0118807436 /NCGR_PEP_ID=MMETSP1161-20130426/35468_1 /TAXON_ID=249345 /ORGANISM="Picochlorum oklahomensis, Strain CCMP2329" /LENGTH=96 /DNA_ID=CAMNT_0006736801 /DNA_START=1829 /DNA_END=2119 /DNA_ORIENTATION=+
MTDAHTLQNNCLEVAGTNIEKPKNDQQHSTGKTQEYEPATTSMQQREGKRWYLESLVCPSQPVSHRGMTDAHTARAKFLPGLWTQLSVARNSVKKE